MCLLSLTDIQDQQQLTEELKKIRNKLQTDPVSVESKNAQGNECSAPSSLSDPPSVNDMNMILC